MNKVFFAIVIACFAILACETPSTSDEYSLRFHHGQRTTCTGFGGKGYFPQLNGR